MNTYHKRIGWRLVAAVFAPMLLSSAYLFFTRWPKRIDTGTSDAVALVISSLVGTAFIALLPIHPVLRAVAALAYLPLIGTCLVFYAFCFVGMVFGDWL